MANPHGTSASSLPLRIENLFCSCQNHSAAVRICLGCYKHFCMTCFQQHRRQISAQFGHIIHESDIVLQAIRPTLVNDKQNHIFNPIQLRKQIDDCHDKLTNEVNLIKRRALRSLKTLMDERSDCLVNKINPITATNLMSWKDFKHYIETHLEEFKEEFKEANDGFEKESKSIVVFNMDRVRDIDWNHLIELQTVQQTSSGRNRTSGVLSEPHFEYLQKGYKPFKTIENQGIGNAIAASDHLIMYTRNDNELCIVESHADYRILIPVPYDSNTTAETIDIIDLCWSSAAGVFIGITDTQLFAVSPNRKIPTFVTNIRPPQKSSFNSCACSGSKLLLSWTNNKSSSIQEWTTTEWEHKCSWNPPESCAEGKTILCMRFNSSGSLLGVTLTESRKAARFEVRDPNKMTSIWSRELSATSCISILSFTDSIWLVGVFCYHKIFLVDKNQTDVKEILTTDPQRSSLRNMTVVDQATVVIRTGNTVTFFDLFN